MQFDEIGYQVSTNNKMNVPDNILNGLPKLFISTRVQPIVQDMIWLGGTGIYKYWFNIECQGLENLPKNEGYIIAANHTSHLDGPAVVAAHGQHMRQIYSLAAKDYFFNQPFKAWFCRHALNMIPFNRRGRFFDCLPTCRKLITEKKGILFFPEGTRSTNGKFQKLKPGIGLLVSQLSVPIIPAYIQGTYQALPKGKFLPHKYPIKVYFGTPLRFNKKIIEYHKSDEHHKLYHEISNDVYLAIKRLMSHA